jgi:hypothetical protein
MKPIFAMFNDFFKNPDTVIKAIYDVGFDQIVSPMDGITYSGIHIINDANKEAFQGELALILGEEVIINSLFARVMYKDVGGAVNKIHSDKIMGEYACHVYLSRHWPIGAGTSFWSHNETGSDYHFDGKDELYDKDTNDLGKWTRVGFCQGFFNRILIHDSRLWHCAEPIGGWGETAKEGRLVLTCFFSIYKD